MREARIINNIKQALSRYYNFLTFRINKIQFRNTINYVTSCLSLIFIFIFITSLSYYREPLGDDVLSQFTHGSSLYLDNNIGNIGNRINDLSSLYESVKNGFLTWGGRIMGFTLFPLLSLFGHAATAIITGICFVFLILLAGWLIFNNTKDIFEHPLIIILLFFILYYNNRSIGYLLMWVMTSIYIISVILLGTYYFLFQNKFLFQRIISNKWNIILYNILGFFAGITHEVFSFTILSLIIFLTAREIIKNKLPLKRFFYHTGLFLGTILVFSAPGNFVRIANSHDSVPMSQPFINKISSVIRYNLSVTAGENRISLIIFAVLITIIIMQYNNKKVFLPFLKNNYVDILFLFYIIIIWSIFPYMGIYGTLLFLFWFSVLIFKNIYIYPYKSKSTNILLPKFKKSIFNLSLVVSIIIILCAYNYSWMLSMAKTTIERRTIIEKAIKKNEKYVSVPLYDDKASNRFTLYNYNNYAGEDLETEYYVRYFGIHMQVKH